MVIDTSKVLSGSWKTTSFGLISAAAAFALANPNLFAKWPWVNSVAGFVVAGGLAGMGIAGKDSNVTGGNKANPTNNPNVVATTANPRGQ